MMTMRTFFVAMANFMAKVRSCQLVSGKKYIFCNLQFAHRLTFWPKDSEFKDIKFTGKIKLSVKTICEIWDFRISQWWVLQSSGIWHRIVWLVGTKLHVTTVCKKIVCSFVYKYWNLSSKHCIYNSVLMCFLRLTNFLKAGDIFRNW
jgi:hypothetical protein